MKECTSFNFLHFLYSCKKLRTQILDKCCEGLIFETHTVRESGVALVLCRWQF